MKVKEFGATGMTVSEVGFGGSRIGGVFADKNSTKEALNVLRKAFDSGITFYDTADMYAQGESEALIGAAFRECRDRVIIASKGGYSLPARRNMIKRIKPLVRPIIQALGLKRARLPAGMSGALSQDFSPAYLTRALEASLKRLKTDYVDLYQLHSPGVQFMQSDAFGEALQTLDKLRAQGKLRFYGIATEVPEEAPYCLSAPGISSLQIAFGVIDQEALDQGTLYAAAQRGLGVIARGCFAGGFLKDELDETQLQGLTPKWQDILALRSFSKSKGRSALDIAFQFCRATPAVSVTLLGMRVESHLRNNLHYVEGHGLSAEEYSALRKLAHQRSAVA